MKVVSMVKGEERFIFRYEHENEVFEAIMAMANHNNVGFDWQDASVMHNQVRRKAIEVAELRMTPMFGI